MNELELGKLVSRMDSLEKSNESVLKIVERDHFQRQHIAELMNELLNNQNGIKSDLSELIKDVSLIQKTDNARVHTAIGFVAATALTSGNNNVAVGAGSLQGNQTGINNVAVGYQCLIGVTTSSNTAVGSGAGSLVTTGSSNTLIGQNSAVLLSSGSNNIAIGISAGSLWNSSESGNIAIGNNGTATDNNAIRIGSSQTACFVAGINGTAVGASVGVIVSASGQLGTIVSSQRYKNTIQPVSSDIIDRALTLNPVSFYYNTDETRESLQYGLIAEQVAETLPDFVQFTESQTGVRQPETVYYQFLPAVLLDICKRQERDIVALRAETESLRNAIANLTSKMLSC